MDDDVELRRLRERVYGVDGARATGAMIARLAELEDRARPAAEPPAAPPIVTAEPEHIGDAPDAAPSAPRRTRGALAAVAGAAVVAAIALVGIGFSIGAATAAPPAAADPAPTSDPAAAMYPELTFRQTIEDAISADVLRDSAIASGSTRYIATVSDFRIYFAQPDDGDGRCIVTFTSSDNRPWSAGCASGQQQGAAIFGIDDGLTVVIGDADDSEVVGIPMRLSESVTAYVAQ